LSLVCDGIRVQMTGSVKDLKDSRPLRRYPCRHGTGDADGPQTVFPFGLLPTPVVAYIRETYPGGTFPLAQGTLQGRGSRIAGLGRENSGDVLKARIHVEGGTLSHGSQMPLFTGIKGVLAVDGIDVSLQGMTGRFGRSPLTLDGAIRQDPRRGGSTVAVRATLKAGNGGLGGLLGEEAVKSLSRKGFSLSN
jgi:hypothetical protein